LAGLIGYGILVPTRFRTRGQNYGVGQDTTLPNGDDPEKWGKGIQGMSVGQLVELTTGQIYLLGFEPMTIGRHQDGDVVLSDPQVSRQHAEIVMEGARWVIRDLDSANGTLVNGQRIDGPYVLAANDVVEIGQTRFRFEVQLSASEQDTMVTRRPFYAAEPGRKGLSWLAVGLAVVAVVAVILVGVFAFWPRTQDGSDVAQGPPSTESVPATTASATAFEPGAPSTTESLAPIRSTATAIPTVAPPTVAPVAPPPTEVPTDTPAPEPVIGYFRTDQTNIEEGQCTRLEWGDVEGASSVTLSGVGRVGLGGKLDVCLSANKIYTLQATGAGGTAERSIEITVQPPAGPVVEYFRVIPSIISPGDCAQLEWGKVDNAISASIEPGIGGVGTPGSQEVCPDSTTTYVLTSEDASGTSETETTLIVSAGTDPKPVIAFFTADPANLETGECTTLNWGKVDYASEVTIDHNIGGVATPDGKEVCLGTTTTFLMTAVGPGGTTEKELTVNVSPRQLADLPDLVIESILFEPNPCYRAQTCKVRVKVRNDGPVTARHLVVRWAPDGMGVVPVEWDMDSLGADQEITLNYNWIPNRTGEDWRTVARVDAYDEVVEIGEGVANTLEQYITVLER
jgi:pSer/pThr/pTyr-binding forkhead associated (FHA) protein